MTGSGDRFLIVRLGALGDVIHGMPVVAALRAHYPGAQIDWAADPRYVGLLRGLRGLDDVLGVDPRAGGRRLWTAVRTLRRRRYTTVFDLQGLVKSAVLSRLSGGRRVVGFSRMHVREPAATLFYTRAIEPAGATHVIRKNLALLTAVGIVTDRIEVPLEAAATAASRTVAERFEPAGYVVLNAGAAWPNKCWPPERFGAVAARVQERTGLRSIVLWGPGEEELARAVVVASSGAAVLAPETTILDIAAIAARSRLVISGDTGPAHLAAAVGAPVVGLFGPTDPQRNGPWAARDVVVSRYDSCSCRYERRCHESVRCIDSISTSAVVDAAERRLAMSR